MSAVEVDQGEFEAAKRAQVLLNQLLEDPKHGLNVKRMVKDKYPQARIPEMEIADQYVKPVMDEISMIKAQNEALTAQFNEYKQAAEIDKATNGLKASLDKVKHEYNFTDDGMAQVIETMRERNLAHDPEAAAALVQSKMPKPKPTSVRSSMLSPELDIYGLQSKQTDEKWGTLHSDPWKFFTDEVISVMDEAQAAE